MKRISNIVNPKGVVSERLERMENRILRQVEQARDSVKDQIADLEETGEKLIDQLGKFAGTDGTPKLQNALMEYCEVQEKIAVYSHYVEHLNTLRGKLGEEVNITPMPVTQVEVVNATEKK